LKQLVSIFLIATFAFSQYAKQLAYMECKLANSFKSSTEQCDCEKKYDIHSLNDKKPAGPLTHFHPVIDEYYAAPENNTATSSINRLIEKATLPSSQNLCDGNNSVPYRPPQA
jgi:predicted metalloendopeptidase